MAWKLLPEHLEWCFRLKRKVEKLMARLRSNVTIPRISSVDPIDDNDTCTGAMRTGVVILYGPGTWIMLDLDLHVPRL